MDPIQKQVAMYQDAYKSLGLDTIKQQYEKYAKEQNDLTNEMNDKMQETNNNPWLSESVRARTNEQIKNKYATRLDNLTHLQQLTDSLYKQGLAQVDHLVSDANADIKATNELAQKQIDSANALAKDNQVVGINGRMVLISKITGKTIADLGPDSTVNTLSERTALANATKKASGSGGGSGGGGYGGGTFKRDLEALVANAYNLIPTKNGKEAFTASINGARGDADKINALATVILRNAPADTRRDFTNQADAVKNIERAIAVIDSGAKTGLFQAGTQYSFNLAGKDYDPKLAAIGAYITSSIQPYRNSITGAAFSAQEMAEYTQMFGSTKYSPTELRSRLMRVKEIMTDKSATALNSQINPLDTYDNYFDPQNPVQGTGGSAPSGSFDAASAQTKYNY